MIKRWISKITGRASNVAAKTTSEIPERLDDLLRSPGRACTATLHSVAQSLSKEDFLNLVHCPSLVGTAVREGELGKSSARIGDALNNPTFLFTAAQVASFVDGVSIEEKGKEIFAKVLEVASGTQSKSEELGYGDAEFVPWTIGATM